MSDGLTTIAQGRARERWRELLELADEPEPLDRCLQDGVLYGVIEPVSERPRAAVLVVDRGDGAVELRAVAVAEREQGAGLGSRIVAAVCDRLAAAGARRVVVGTASSGTRQLAFYQRLGFRPTHVERDFFTAARGYPSDLVESGIRVRDMVWMDREL